MVVVRLGTTVAAFLIDRDETTAQADDGGYGGGDFGGVVGDTVDGRAGYCRTRKYSRHITEQDTPQEEREADNEDNGTRYRGLR